MVTFATDFEEAVAFSDWTGTVLGPPSTVEVQGTVKHSNNYAMKSVLDAWSNNSVVYKLISSLEQTVQTMSIYQ
jgi:hypothetical protein